MVRINMRYSRSQLLLTPFLVVLDISFIGLALFLAYELRFFSFLTDIFPVTRGIPPWSFYEYALYFIVPLFLFIFFQSGMYRVYFLPMIDDLIRVVRSVTIGIIFLILTSFFYRDVSYSRLVFFFFWGIGIFLVFSYREMFKLFARTIFLSLHRRENVLIVGKDNQMLRSLLKKHPHFQVYFHPFNDEEGIEKIKGRAVEKSVSQIIMVHHGWQQNKMLEMYDWCENRKIDLKFVPDIVQLCRGEVSIDSSLGIPIFHLRPVSLEGFNFYFKRIIDIVVATFILSVTWPLLSFIAILIKVDSPGPFFYHHKRMGYRGKVFNFYKFRTMVMNADALLEKFKNQSERKGPVFKMSNDPRVTHIGKILRRYSIDEVPQLINVLRGEMSLVGPRPQVLWEASAYDDWAKRRLRTLPGITGLWQVSGRANLSYEEMIELDIYYIENWTPGMDIEILLKTIPAVFSKKGAY